MSETTLTVVIPAFNASRTLARLLDSLARSESQPDEVIVVDDGSEDPLTPEGADLNLRWLRLDHRGPVAARNAGWRAASSPWIVFVDSDCTVEPGWCSAYRRSMRVHPHAAVLEGVVSETFKDGFFRHWAENRRAGRFPTANIAYRREVLAIIGGLDPMFQWGAFYFREDSDLALRATAFGPAVWVEDAVVCHHGRPITVMRKLREACRYALDPPFICRHGMRGMSLDGVTLGRWRLPAPRQLTGVFVSGLWLGGVGWHVLWPAAVAATAVRAAFVVRHEGMAWREAPLVAAEQVLEPLVVCGALLVGAVRLVMAGRRDRRSPDVV